MASSLAPMIPDGEFMYPPASPDRHQSATPPRLLQASPNEWNTPNIFKRKGDLLDSTPGPLYLQQLFGEEEYNLDAERPRKRPRFSTSFRMVERTPSPQPEGEEDIFDEGPSLGDIEAARLAAMPDGPLTVFRDGPSPKRAFNRPTRIEMPPPPLPLIGAEMDDDQYGETPDSPSLNPAPSQQLPLVSPFPHHGLSEEDDYMSVDTEDRSKITTAPIQESTAPTQEGAESAQEGISPEEALTPAQEEPSGPITSDGESEIDSLFDEMSDREDTRPRKRSGSPLPGPSPLRKFERAKTPEISTSSKKSKLNLQLSTSPIAHRETPRSTPKTPHIYLPTPSPKTLSSEHMGFPFTAPARLDFGARNPEKTPASVQKRNRLRHSLDSAPDDLTTYFGRKKHPKAEKEQTKQLEDSSLTGTPVDEPSTPTEGSIQALRPRSETHKERSPGFKSGIVTPVSTAPATMKCCCS